MHWIKEQTSGEKKTGENQDREKLNWIFMGYIYSSWFDFVIGLPLIWHTHMSSDVIALNLLWLKAIYVYIPYWVRVKESQHEIIVCYQFIAFSIPYVVIKKTEWILTAMRQPIELKSSTSNELVQIIFCWLYFCFVFVFVLHSHTYSIQSQKQILKL